MASVYSMTPNLKGFVDRLNDLSYCGMWSICSVSVLKPACGIQEILLYPGMEWICFVDGDISKIFVAARAFNLRFAFVDVNGLPIIRIQDYCR